jgi:hypothetical protein
MALYARLIGTEAPKLHVHAFMAALGELERGKMTTQQVIDAFTLSAQEQVEASALIATVVSPVESISFGGFVTLSNVGSAYDTTSAARGLGICRLQTAGITGFEFGVSVNKVGSGTQSWQLWNETDATEVAVIDDAGAAGNKQLVTSASVAPLGPALKTLRVRVKSTVSADDPVFYGATLMVQRIGIMTADVLHQVLLLAEARLPPLDTPAALQARLGL